MKFLKESWENMSEDEGGEDKLLNSLNMIQVPPAFKLVTSKTHKKNFKAQ